MTNDQLGKAIVAAGLMPVGDLKALWSSIPAEARPKDAKSFAELLIQQGKLNKFQAAELLSGSNTPLVLGDYQLLAKIGAGGMGQVFKAQHRHMKRTVAIKLLPAELTKDEGAIKRFQREVEAAAKLSHPNIVQAHDASLQRGIWYLVMEYVEGLDLAHIIATEGSLPIPRAVNYIRQSARGLGFAHENGVVHRDIKPANLLLDKKGTIKILDMGLARFDDGMAAAQEGLTQSGQVMGTVDYMAPEQAFDTRHADARADIYSLGCTLYRLLTAQNMYEGESLVQKLMGHQSKPIPKLSKARPDVPPPLEAIFERMVAKDSKERYQTMSEVLAALAPFEDPSKAGDTGGLTAHFEGIGGGTATNAALLAQPTAAQLATGEVMPTISLNHPLQSTDPVSARSIQLVRQSSPQLAGINKPPVNRKKLLIAAGGLGGLLAVLLGIWVIIKDKDGNEVARVQVPEGGTATVQGDNATDSTRNTSNSTTVPPANYALEFDGKSYVVLPAMDFNIAEPMTIEAKVSLIKGRLPGTRGKMILGFRQKEDWLGLYVDGNESLGSVTTHIGRAPNEAKERLAFSHTGGKQPIPLEESNTLAISWTGKDRKVFVNGKLVSGSFHDIPKPIFGEESLAPVADLGIIMGAVSVAGDKPLTSFFKGQLDEVRISKGARYAKDYIPQVRLESDKDTIALYHFDEGTGDTLRDSSGNNHHGKIVGAKWVKGEAAMRPNLPTAIQLQQGNRIDFPEFRFDLRTPLTMEAFVRVTEEGRGKFFGERVHFNVQMDGTKRGCHGRLTSYYAPAEEVGMPVGARVHVAIEQNGSSTILYVNGRMVRSMNHEAYSEPTEKNTFFVGGGTGAFVIDSIRVSSVNRYKLGSGEKKDYPIPTVPFTADADTLALYNFDEGTGDVLNDSSGNNHHGKIVGAKWVSAQNSNQAELPGPQLAALLDSSEYEWSKPENLGANINTQYLDLLAGISSDERTIYVYRQDEQNKVNSKLLLAAKRSRTDEPFAAAEKVETSAPIVDAAVSADQLTCVVSSARDTKTRVAAWADRRSVSEAFPEMQTLSKPGESDVHPVLSADGLTLLCTRGGDIYMWTRAARGQPFANAQRLPDSINKPAWEMPAFISNDRLLTIVMSQAGDTSDTVVRKVSYHTRVSERDAFGAGKPLNIPLGAAQTSNTNSGFRLTGDGRRIYFTATNYPGGRGHSDLWVSRLGPKAGATGSASAGTTPYPDDLVYNGHRYRYVNLPKGNHSDAKFRAAKLGGKLAVITDQKEFDLVQKLIPAGTPAESRIWINGVRTRHEPNWKWDTGEPWGFTAWDAQEPNVPNVTTAHILLRVTANGAKWVDESFDYEDKVIGCIVEWDSTLSRAGTELDLLPLVELTQDLRGGEWKKDGTGFIADKLSTDHWLRLPVEPGEEYALRTAFSNHHGNVSVVLPLEGKPAEIFLSSKRIELCLKMLNDPSNPKSTLPFEMNDNKRHEALVEVTRPSDSEVKITVTVDGTRGFEWQGTREQLRALDARGVLKPELTFGSYLINRDGPVKLLEAKLTTTRGTMKPLRALTANSKPWETPAFQAWLKETQALPAEQQLEAVSKKLIELNPGFDGKVLHKVDQGVVVEFECLTNKVTDLSPVRCFTGLRTLRVKPTSTGGVLRDLTPLQGLKLINLVCAHNKDLSDLSPLQDMPLNGLIAHATSVSDLTPLRGMPLESLHIGNTKVTSLAPLEGAPLVNLFCDLDQLSDHSPLLSFKSLKLLDPGKTKVPDQLRQALPNCRILGEATAKATAPQPAASSKLWMHDPAFPQWLKETQALPAEQQLEAVSKKLIELNPGFDGQIRGTDKEQPYIQNGNVETIRLTCDHLLDLSPLRVFSQLNALDLYASDSKRKPFSDLSSLQGLKLRHFNLPHTQVSDLSLLAGMPLVTLNIADTPVEDLSPLTGSTLTRLHMEYTKITDLRPLLKCKYLTLVEGKKNKLDPASVAALKQAYPQCVISWDEPGKE